MSAEEHAVASAWRAALDRPGVSGELEALFTLVADQISLRGPACWASGRCCNFEAFGHRLFVTGLEAAWVVRHAALEHGAIEAARARGGCPYQRENLCGIHDAKPLACRVFFCDRSAEEWQRTLMERLMIALRRLHDRHAVPYRYLEWREALRIVSA
ncbi:MAG: hypothetical protein AB7K52_10070 [Phycisphaerales bacterium]